MADNLTDAEENRLLDLSLPGTGMFVRLTSTTPTDSAAGTELSGNGYTPKAITFAAASGGSKTSSAEVLFDAVTGADWVTILGIEIWDAASGGNRRWYRPLAVGERRTPAVGDQYRIANGALSFSLT